MKLKLLILVLSLQTAWILGTSIFQERALAVGKLVLLETLPVDPRDLLRGDYLILNYKISDVRMDRFPPSQTNGVAAGKNVYVALQQRGQFYEVVRASTEKLKPEDGEVILKGRSKDWWNASTQATVHVEYGLERFYVREGTGNPAGKITIQVAVAASGQARIKEAYLNGKPYVQALKR